MSFPPLETLSTILPQLLLHSANIDTNLTSTTKPFLTSILKLLEHLACYITLVFSICYLPMGRFNTGEIYKGTSALFSSGKAFSFNMGWISHTKHLKGSENLSVLSDSLWPHGLYRPWTSPGQNTGVGNRSLLQASSQPRDQTHVSHSAGGFFTNWAIREAFKGSKLKLNSFFKASVKFFFGISFVFFS